MPLWLRGDIIDVRKIVSALSEVSRIHGLRVCFHKISPNSDVTLISGSCYLAHPAMPHVTEYRKSAAVPRACAVRGKATQWNRCEFPFSVTDAIFNFCSQDSRNIARIVIELARRGVRMVPNTPIWPDRRWPW